MAKVAAYHSKCQEHRRVYHDHDDCTEGNNIEARCRVSGTGGLSRCQHCERLG